MNKKNRVLVVDDETDILEMLDYNLSKEGYEVWKQILLTHLEKFNDSIIGN